MNDLEYYFYNNSDRLIHKWENYFHFYDKYFSKYKNKNVKILEIGVFHGGSLQMWQNYFGKNAFIVGMDINSNCKQFESDGIKIFIGDQNNLNDLQKMIDLYGDFDVIIDDGSHVNEHQINTFKYLFPYLKEGGTYLVEDVHTSYWSDWNGAYKKESTFIEFTKSLLDDINGYAIRPEPIISLYTNYLSDIHIASGMVFFEKNKLKHTPYDIIVGSGKIISEGNILPKIQVI